ncbi:MAG: GSCFA domain-containing protein [Prevotella sp.]|nr:GSCFA domain-containing protein [Prevotella sp.]
MEWNTRVEIEPCRWKIEPCERMLFVGSCFADNMGRRFEQERFQTVVNPYGVMYNPASILHTVERLTEEGRLPFAKDEQGTAVFTLGTNRVYVLKETGEIVDNCQKRPQRLFEEHELTIEECSEYLEKAMMTIRQRFPKVRFIFTVSPIRYRKYGYHGSQLSKATLLLAIDRLLKSLASGAHPDGIASEAVYFPSFEIVNDELRDYRFYKEDMLHPTDQAVEYIYERMAETFFSDSTHDFLRAWKPIQEALNHRPFNPDSDEYKAFLKQTQEKEEALMRQYLHR